MTSIGGRGQKSSQNAYLDAPPAKTE